MNKIILDFLSNQRVSCLTTILKNGSPHASTLHYSHIEDPLEFYFSIESTCLKCEALLDGSTGKASMVVGFSEIEWVTLQMDGTVKAITNKIELEKIMKLHYAKHPNAEQYKNEPDTLFLKFIPTWYRYSDYKTKPLTILQ